MGALCAEEALPVPLPSMPFARVSVHLCAAPHMPNMQTCVRKPLCVPTDDSLTLAELLCFMPSFTPCWQRSYGCGNIWSDVAPYADRLYQHALGHWDFNQGNWWSKVYSNGYGSYGYSEQLCAPYRLLNCAYQLDPTWCTGFCKVQPAALCARDSCSTWDAASSQLITDPCCGHDGSDCRKAPLPLNVRAVH